VFNVLGSRLLGDNVAVVTLILAVCLFAAWIFLSRLRWGRYLYAIGGNEEASWLSGIPVRTMKLLAYGLSGLFCGVAGICQAGQELQGDPEAGAAYELSAIAIVVIGGTSLRGGRGSMWQTLLGILTIGYLEKILSINAVGEESRLMLTGVIIIAAVLFQKRTS
jgi:ribose/xylose/arabinose/galactoside ABC-type transport system permease subunit